MKFGETPLAEAQGAILAHSVKLGTRALKKGRALSGDDIAALKAAGKATVIAARLEPGDVIENQAADRVAAALSCPGVSCAPAFTGRANFYAESAGLCLVDREAIDRFNLIDESITIATIEPSVVVEPKQMVATVKIIPFAVRSEALGAAVAAIKDKALFQVVPFKPHRTALIQTTLPGLKDSVLDKTVETTRDRLAEFGSTLDWEKRCAHDPAPLAPVIEEMIKAGAQLVLVAGASAILDRRDVIPAAITDIGGTIEHFGMPVDPGNLLLMARHGTTPVLGLPGCARSPKVNGFDWVLRRVLAGLPVGANAIRRMGVGGLLSEIASRPLPRARAGGPPKTDVSKPPQRPRIAGIILAAGRSSRMGAMNKLLIPIDGKPMVRRAAEAVLAAQLTPVVVVTGHQREQVEEALKGLSVTFLNNKDFATGMSTSLRVGLDAVPAECDAALVALGDMPLITAAEISQLVNAFNPVEGRAIVVPTRRGKRGNPVLWARRFFGEMTAAGGDVGARHLFDAYPEAVVEVEMAGDGVLTDIDTPQALARLAAARIDA
ncbi:MAG TPA: molybdopterin-binding/glycosyltransferase family 2 protein [Stellaceae bacterium]|jgi:molybdenum cofactor cytidylyltransferase|nr:molybdopterin-binding/glycosyltransferase family 2 protein [Stellaceae bacterium]